MAQFSSRIAYADFNQMAPAIRTALIDLASAAVEAGIEKDLLELIKLRVSQINGCAFCLQYHLNIARGLDVKPEKLDLVAAWRDAGVYSERECAALAWAELVTCVAQEHITDEDFASVRAQFSEKEVVFLTGAICAINSWNRLSVAFRFPPPPRE
ncbi:MAG TPA: carboxymuconolactone decarboxylase family protein [Noviherbaspirillum sp.]|uniref:carboxymuconolactone decarboxylase family protein n=1 Tax=Noviherbaspirillum sp. TaxID=1926288 RepID=UPI002B4862A6|nr:carboxymuconolactone decarboxylase family protein [Noviherbaspirillum sp.]HJV85961.1 carboxymuconolactone decarboxylase family protein [Noviherbaspirillum sp.]